MSNNTGIMDHGFKLYYEDFDRPGTAGVTTKLHAVTIEEAIAEARHFLKQHSQLPQQDHIMIMHSFSVDVTDLKLGK